MSWQHKSTGSLLKCRLQKRNPAVMTPSNYLKYFLPLLFVSTHSSAETLSDIYAQAVQNDPQLRAAKAVYLADRENQNIARGALLPNITASGSYTTSETDGSSQFVFGSITAGREGTEETDLENYEVSLNQAIFNLPAWFEFRSGQQIGKQARAEFGAAQQQLITRVASAYFNVLRANENLETAVAEQTAIERQLQQTRERFEVGLLPITDVHDAQAVFDNARVNTLEAKSALDIAFESLQVLTGQYHQVLAGLAANFPISDPTPATAQAWVDFSLENNFALKAAAYGAEAANAIAKARKYAHLPKVSGTASYYDNYSDSEVNGVDLETNESFSNPQVIDQDGHAFGIQVQMPLFSGGTISASRRQAQQQHIAAKESLLATRRSTVQQARSQHLRVLTNVARVSARKQAITSAESALEATQAGYDVGTRNIVDVLLAQRTLYQARRDYANARYDYIDSILALKETAGQLSPEDLYNLNAWLDPQISVVRTTTQP